MKILITTLVLCGIAIAMIGCSSGGDEGKPTPTPEGVTKSSAAGGAGKPVAAPAPSVQ